MKTPHTTAALDVTRIRAITIDLDDTLWPIKPTIVRAERALQAWLTEHAPASAALAATPGVLGQIRQHLHTHRPELAHDMTALRREAIRHLLQRAGDSPALAEPAFEVFYAERQRVDLFADALPALAFLSSRFPVVAVSNGNADVYRVGLGAHFVAAVGAHQVGVAKPDTRIFHAAAQAAGVPAAQVLHIGDDAQLDGLAALNAGMQAAWINREGLPWLHQPWQPQLTVPDLLALCRQLDSLA